MTTINENNYELWLLRYAEQELTAQEQEAVEQWLAQHPEAAEELALYNAAPRLQRDETIHYAARPRQASTLWPVVRRWAAAAIVAAVLLTSVLLFLRKPATERSATGPLVAKTQPTVNTHPSIQPQPKDQPTMQPQPQTLPTTKPQSQGKASRAESNSGVDPSSVVEAIPATNNDLLAETQEENIPVEPFTAPTLEATQPESVVYYYCDNLIVFEAAPDTFSNYSLIVVDSRRPSLIALAREFVESTVLVQTWRRRVSEPLQYAMADTQQSLTIEYTNP